MGILGCLWPFGSNRVAPEVDQPSVQQRVDAKSNFQHIREQIEPVVRQNGGSSSSSVAPHVEDQNKDCKEVLERFKAYLKQQLPPLRALPPSASNSQIKEFVSQQKAYASEEAKIDHDAAAILANYYASGRSLERDPVNLSKNLAYLSHLLSPPARAAGPNNSSPVSRSRSASIEERAMAISAYKIAELAVNSDGLESLAGYSPDEIAEMQTRLRQLKGELIRAWAKNPRFQMLSKEDFDSAVSMKAKMLLIAECNEGKKSDGVPFGTSADKCKILSKSLETSLYVSKNASTHFYNVLIGEQPRTNSVREEYATQIQLLGSLCDKGKKMGPFDIEPKFRNLLIEAASKDIIQSDTLRNKAHQSNPEVYENFPSWIHMQCLSNQDIIELPGDISDALALPVRLALVAAAFTDKNGLPPLSQNENESLLSYKNRCQKEDQDFEKYKTLAKAKNPPSFDSSDSTSRLAYEGSIKRIAFLQVATQCLKPGQEPGFRTRASTILQLVHRDGTRGIEKGDNSYNENGERHFLCGLVRDYQLEELVFDEEPEAGYSAHVDPTEYYMTASAAGLWLGSEQLENRDELNTIQSALRLIYSTPKVGARVANSRLQERFNTESAHLLAAARSNFRVVTSELTSTAKIPVHQQAGQLHILGEILVDAASNRRVAIGSLQSSGFSPDVSLEASSSFSSRGLDIQEAELKIVQGLNQHTLANLKYSKFIVYLEAAQNPANTNAQKIVDLIISAVIEIQIKGGNPNLLVECAVILDAAHPHLKGWLEVQYNRYLKISDPEKLEELALYCYETAMQRVAGPSNVSTSSSSASASSSSVSASSSSQPVDISSQQVEATLRSLEKNALGGSVASLLMLKKLAANKSSHSLEVTVLQNVTDRIFINQRRGETCLLFIACKKAIEDGNFELADWLGKKFTEEAVKFTRLNSQLGECNAYFRAAQTLYITAARAQGPTALDQLYELYTSMATELKKLEQSYPSSKNIKTLVDIQTQLKKDLDSLAGHPSNISQAYIVLSDIARDEKRYEDQYKFLQSGSRIAFHDNSGSLSNTTRLLAFVRANPNKFGITDLTQYEVYRKAVQQGNYDSLLALNPDNIQFTTKNDIRPAVTKIFVETLTFLGQKALQQDVAAIRLLLKFAKELTHLSLPSNQEESGTKNYIGVIKYSSNGHYIDIIRSYIYPLLIVKPAVLNDRQIARARRLVQAQAGQLTQERILHVIQKTGYVTVQNKFDQSPEVSDFLGMRLLIGKNGLSEEFKTETTRAIPEYKTGRPYRRLAIENCMFPALRKIYDPNYDPIKEMIVEEVSGDYAASMEYLVSRQNGTPAGQVQRQYLHTNLKSKAELIAHQYSRKLAELSVKYPKGVSFEEFDSKVQISDKPPQTQEGKLADRYVKQIVWKAYEKLFVNRKDKDAFKLLVNAKVVDQVIRHRISERLYSIWLTDSLKFRDQEYSKARMSVWSEFSEDAKNQVLREVKTSLKEKLPLDEPERVKEQLARIELLTVDSPEVIEWVIQSPLILKQIPEDQHAKMRISSELMASARRLYEKRLAGPLTDKIAYDLFGIALKDVRAQIAQDISDNPGEVLYQDFEIAVMLQLTAHSNDQEIIQKTSVIPYLAEAIQSQIELPSFEDIDDEIDHSLLPDAANIEEAYKIKAGIEAPVVQLGAAAYVGEEKSNED